jgi:UDP-N-acetylmuramate: L-alanyl-gamma-D-glutamyl-meso-diaminopimelate ligase
MSETPRRVRFVAIGGTGMGSLAGPATRGLRVTGSDDHLYPPMSTLLEGWGIPVNDGFRAEHALAADPDLVVIGNAVRPDNAEARAVIDEGLPYRSFSDALYELAIAGKHSVVVSGTHGKTTTTSLLASLLLRCGRDPSLLVGGHALDFDGSFREGSGDHFVVEGDEYDTAFFDKTPKFLHYHPRTLIVTSVEFDHADIYRDLEHVKDAFRALIRQMPRDGLVVAALAHEGVRDVVRGAPCRVVGYGVAAVLVPASELTPMRGARRCAGPAVALGGRAQYGAHNVETLARSRVAELGVPIAMRSPRSPGSGRAASLRGARRARGITVLDDFAHHPAGGHARGGARPGRRVVAIFEPRTSTAAARFSRAVCGVVRRRDQVIRVVPDTPIYSVTGEVTEKFSAGMLANDLSVRGVPAVALPDVDAIVAHVAATARPGDVAVVMSNGDFGGVWEKLLAALAR